MTSQDLEHIMDSLKETIKETVNGKIDAMRKDLNEHNTRHEAYFEQVKEYMKKTDGHIEETKPILEAYRGFNTAGELIKWVAGVGTAIGILWLILKQWITGK